MKPGYVNHTDILTMVESWGDEEWNKAGNERAATYADSDCEFKNTFALLASTTSSILIRFQKETHPMKGTRLLLRAAVV